MKLRRILKIMLKKGMISGNGEWTKLKVLLVIILKLLPRWSTLLGLMVTY